MNFVTPGASVTSSFSWYAFPLIMLADFSALATFLEHTMTVAPRAASSLVIPNPIPLLAPVTTATLPFSTWKVYAIWLFLTLAQK
jgi:hypothetical protein